jgi:hypothetical protein
MSLSIIRRSSTWRPFGRRSAPAVGTSNITTSPDLPWDSLGAADSCLFRELEQMYWDGVKREIEVILITLRKWQESDCGLKEPEEDNDDFIHGFDTFIDQVSQESRAFAIHYGK